MRGVVAAGHPLTAEAGAQVLREGGNAVDAAVAAVLTSFVAEPLLTGLGSGGYLLVVPPGGPAVLLDFFVEAPRRGVVRHVRYARRARRGRRAVRPRPAGRAHRPGRPAGPRRRAGHAHAGLPLRAARRDQRPDAGRPGPLPARRRA